MVKTDYLVKLISSDNIAEMLKDSELASIGQQVIQDTQVDEDSRRDWISIVEKGMEIAKQVYTRKSFPWDGAANVKYPLIANAAITFAARIYPQIVRGNKVVEAAVIGKDIDGTKQKTASRLSTHMSNQLLNSKSNWEKDTDQLLHVLAVVGTVFRKTYFSPITQKPTFELCKPDDIIVNNNVKSLEEARRVTHRLNLYTNDIIERQRLGLFTDIEIEKLDPGTKDPQSTLDNDAPHEILEQHTFLDLDDDGYKEPYIVTVHKKSGKVLRIMARYSYEDIEFTRDNKAIKCIRPKVYFVDYHFIPNPDGSFYSLGFGTLLYPLNESINTLINQLLDSGTLHNSQSGFIGSGCRIEGGAVKVALGKFLKVDGIGGRDLHNNIMPLPTKEPSAVLFELLGLMIQTGNDIGSISDILKGDMPTQNSPATSVLALIKQGLVQFNAIHKRVLRALAKEFELLFQINCANLNESEYLTLLDDPLASKDDYNIENISIQTVADPNMSSDAQRMAQAQALMQIPTVDPRVATRIYLEALDIPDQEIEQLLPQPDPSAPPPPEVQKLLAEAEKLQADAKSTMLDHKARAAELEIKRKEQEASLAKLSAEIHLLQMQAKATGAQAVATLSNADLAHKQLTVDTANAALDRLDKENSHAAHRKAASGAADILQTKMTDNEVKDENSSIPGGPVETGPSDAAPIPSDIGPESPSN